MAGRGVEQALIRGSTRESQLANSIYHLVHTTCLTVICAMRDARFGRRSDI